MCERLRSNHESAAHRDAVSMEESSSAGIKSFTDVAMIAGGGGDVNERFAAFPCAFAPHPPDPLLPQSEKGKFGPPDDQNERRNAGASQKPTRGSPACVGDCGATPACAGESRAPYSRSGRDATSGARRRRAPPQRRSSPAGAPTRSGRAVKIGALSSGMCRVPSE